MEQYIPKTSVVAEIEKVYNEEIDTYTRNILDMLKSNIDTLEAKEIDFKDTKSVFEGQYLIKDKVVTTIERLQDECEERGDNNGVELLEKLFNKLDTLEVKEVDFCTISENLMEAHEYLDFTHTSNLAHNKPMVAARLKKAIRELYNAGLLKLTHDEKYRIESLGLKALKGEK